MKLIEIIEEIKKEKNCKIFPTINSIELPENTPNDLKEFYKLTNGISLFEDKPFGIKIVGREEFIPTNKYLYPENDVIWEELEGEICNQWFLIGKADELSQFISIDLTKERNGQCYDSFYDTHSIEGDSRIISRNFTELLENLYKQKGQNWYWLEDDFEELGDAYDEPLNK